MVVNAYFHDIEESKHAYAKNGSRSMLSESAIFYVFKTDLKLKNIIASGNDIVIPIPIQDVEPWMGEPDILRDFEHPTGDVSYIFGANDFGGLDALLMANKADLENNPKVHWVTIPTAGVLNGGEGNMRSIYGHMCAVLVFYDRSEKELGF